MASITYIAKDEIEKTGYSKSGTDISAAASDDSFNAASTNLSGLLDDQWIQVAGFANAANNGWFQANGNSISTKISQDTSSSLVDEAAGPAVSIVGYVRGLGQSYSIDFALTAADRSVTVERNKQQPLGGGAPEITFYRRQKFYSVTTSLFTEAQMKQVREFLASVDDGSQFTFDPYGTSGSPDSPHPAMLDSDGYSEQRADPTTFNYRVSFRVLLLD